MAISVTTGRRLLTLSSLGIVTWFLGSATATLVGASVARAGPVEKWAATGDDGAHSLSTASAADRSPDAICRHNAFDSARRPCRGRGPVPRPGPEPEALGCQGASRLVGTIVTDDPDWALAIIDVSGQVRPFRVGDPVPGLGRLDRVGWRLARFELPEGRCLLDLHRQGEGPRPISPGSSEQRRDRGHSRGRGLPADLRAALDTHVRVVSSTERVVDRRLVEILLSRVDDLSGEARVVPQSHGLGLSRLRRGGVLETLGLRSGDVLQRVNHVETRSVDGMIRAYTELQHARQLTVTVLRGGRPVALGVEVL